MNEDDMELTGETETINGRTYQVYRTKGTRWTYIEINNCAYPTGMTPFQEKWHRNFGSHSKFAKVMYGLILAWGIAVCGYAVCTSHTGNEPQQTHSSQTNEDAAQGSSLERIIEQ
ncbi:MAG: hypothetical protein WC852_04370 [Candidatus Nanoarchaeia archaeon]|jgi:hypothetical protein